MQNGSQESEEQSRAAPVVEDLDPLILPRVPWGASFQPGRFRCVADADLMVLGTRRENSAVLFLELQEDKTGTGIFRCVKGASLETRQVLATWSPEKLMITADNMTSELVLGDADGMGGAAMTGDIYVDERMQTLQWKVNKVGEVLFDPRWNGGAETGIYLAQGSEDLINGYKYTSSMFIELLDDGKLTGLNKYTSQQGEAACPIKGTWERDTLKWELPYLGRTYTYSAELKSGSLQGPFFTGDSFDTASSNGKGQVRHVMHKFSFYEWTPENHFRFPRQNRLVVLTLLILARREDNVLSTLPLEILFELFATYGFTV